MLAIMFLFGCRNDIAINNFSPTLPLPAHKFLKFLKRVDPKEYF